MYLMPQGVNLSPKVKELEKRVELLENVVKVLQSSQRPKLGRPPKDTHGTERTEVNSTSRN